jgi:hypothetical protein
MPRQPEAKLVRSIQDFLYGRGAAVFKIHGGDNPFQAAGIPDLLACYEGRFYGFEVKVPPNKPSALQLAVLREIREAGGVGAIVTSVADVRNLLTFDPGWIAGFYEGEGTVFATTRPKNDGSRGGRISFLRVAISQKDPSALRYIQGYFGGNIRKGEAVHVLSFSRTKEVMRFLETVGPLLKSEYKRKQLRAAVRKVEEATGESLRLRGYSHAKHRST